jgi:N-acetylmuramoyl-L-alanine amidase CwlA
MNIIQSLLTPNPYSRPQDKLKDVRGVVIHWVANSDSTAAGNRNFFENRKYGKTNYGSAHFIVDLDGKKVQCLPENEVGYHVGSHVYTSHALNRLSSYPNNCTLGIECTHVDWNGKMTSATYESTLELAVYLLKKYELDENDLWLHKTVVGWKDCHRYFVNNNTEWVKFKTKAGEMLRGKAQLNKEVDTNDMEYVSADKDGYYTIKKGDTYWGISKALDIEVKDIEKLNPKVDAGNLQVGQKIKVKEVNKASSSKDTPAASYSGNSIVDYLNVIGEDASFSNRKKLAAKYGISNYSGSLDQNLTLLNKLRNSAPAKSPTSPKPAPTKGNMKTDSIVEYLNSIGVDSSYSNRKKLAAKYGIKGYNGEASENLRLLDLMRKGKVNSAPKSNAKYLNLHKHMKEWGVYNLKTTRFVEANQIHQLRPSKFNGLSYKILGNPHDDIYTIQTDDFGKVNIYAPRDRDSSITSSPLYK